MKDTKDAGTTDMFGVKRGRGRPSTGQALSGAERQAAYRAKQQQLTVTVTINRDDAEQLLTLLAGLAFGHLHLAGNPGVSPPEPMDRERTRKLATTLAQAIGPDNPLRG
jgi:hypothetical protein